jgi:hypothetical protein
LKAIAGDSTAFDGGSGSALNTSTTTAQKPVIVAPDEDLRDAVKDTPSSHLPPLEIGKPIPTKWLNLFKDEALRSWAATLICERELWPDPTYGVAASQTLVINPETFNGTNLDDNVRLNLMAFELGKVFYQKYGLNSVINSLDAYQKKYSFDDKKYPPVSPATLDLGDSDAASFFGYVFRVELLKIPTQGALWNGVNTQFQDIVGPITKQKPSTNTQRKPIEVPSP